jgi:DNA repair protein RecN (Recombination protein N)
MILEGQINQELKSLISQGSSFKIELESCKDQEKVASNGIDQVRFKVSTNSGMPLMPIDQVASGGEMSRIMLALKSVMLEGSVQKCVIFDEIDTGVGGAVAELIGDKLHFLSQSCQIISITHQAQIAGKGDQHLLVFKRDSANKTLCNVATLTGEQRIEELARMISGKKISQKARDVAKEMINS